MQRRYQHGTLTKRKRKNGPDVWQWRWSENGKRVATVIGTVKQYPSQSSAFLAVEGRRLKINAESPQLKFHGITMGALMDRFIVEELPRNCRYSTRVSYLTALNNYIRPKWGKTILEGIRPMSVEDWLSSLCRKADILKPLAPKTKTHIRNLMHLIFQCAMRWELTERNPIALVRQSSQRLCAPRILKPQEFVALLAELREPYKTMVLVAGGLGLRASEVIGLQWGDFDWENLTLLISRSVVHGRTGKTKTEASQKAIPLEASLAATLKNFREHKDTHYRTAADFVFAGENGKPRWQETILTDYIKPAAARAKIGNVGWHTFRHTYATMLHGIGAPLAVQKELLRHADIQTTMNVYTQAIPEEKRNAAIKAFQSLTSPKAKEAAVSSLLQ